MRGYFLVHVSAAKPGVYSGGAVLLFPGFEAAVVATFGLDQLAGVRVVVNLDHPCAALFWRRGGRCAAFAWRWIEDGDHIAQAFVVFAHQRLELFFEFDFFLQASVVLQGFQLGKLLLKGFFCCAKFGESGQNLYSNNVVADINCRQSYKPRTLSHVNEKDPSASSAQAEKIVVVNSSRVNHVF